MKQVVASWIVVAVLGMIQVPSAHGANDAAACEKDWLARSGDYSLREDFAGLLDYWKSQESKCRGTVAYEARLATIYFHLNQPAKAREAIAPVAGIKSSYDNLIELAAIMTEMGELTQPGQPPVEERQFRDLETTLETYLQRYPAMPAAHALLGTIKNELGDHEGAIKAFEAGLAIDDPTVQKWGLWRHLAVSYTKVGRYTDALNAAGGSIQSNPNVTRDREFMYAMATSETHLGLLDDAQTALKLTLHRYPEAKEEPEYQAVAKLLYDKLQEKKQSASP